MADKARLGRPPSSSSAETRGRIVDVARRCFAELGYEATTNRMLASEAGITTGAIYHYFESKLDIFEAVHREAAERVFVRFRQAEAGSDTFMGRLEAVLEAAHQLNCDDPTLAQFLGASRVDRQRIPELRQVLPAGFSGRSGYFDGMVDRGIETGEIDEADREQVKAVIRTITVGLSDAVSHDNETHRNAIDGIKGLLEGKLIGPPG